MQKWEEFMVMLGWIVWDAWTAHPCPPSFILPIFRKIFSSFSWFPVSLSSKESVSFYCSVSRGFYNSASDTCKHVAMVFLARQCAMHHVPQTLFIERNHSVSSCLSKSAVAVSSPPSPPRPYAWMNHGSYDSILAWSMLFTAISLCHEDHFLEFMQSDGLHSRSNFTFFVLFFALPEIWL